MPTNFSVSISSVSADTVAHSATATVVVSAVGQYWKGSVNMSYTAPGCDNVSPSGEAVSVPRGGSVTRMVDLSNSTAVSTTFQASGGSSGEVESQSQGVNL